MEQEQKDSINARGADNPSVDNTSGPETPPEKRKHGGGPKPKGYYQADVNEVLNNSARTAARVLQEHIDQKKGRRNLKSSLQRACEFVIDHAIGKARFKVEHSGGIMTYGELAKSAENLDKKPRPILSEVMEIANKYQGETPAPDGATGPDPGPVDDNKPANNPEN